MATHAQIAARLLRDAATFIKNVGAQNEPIRDQMNDNALVYEQVAALTETDPLAKLEADGPATHIDIAIKLLRDAATFFRNVGSQNDQIRDQMNENANVYDQVAALCEKNPNGTLDIGE